MLEHIVLHHLNKKLDTMLHNRQHGFRRGLSCETQLCGTFHQLARSANNGNTTHALIFDFQKAFDKVPHALLMAKLREIDWIHKFLTDRKQQVVVENRISTTRPVTSGVPQGSVLGPALFLIYINDLPNTLDCDISLFADDTLLFQEIQSPQDVERFQRNIDHLYNWSQQWKMPFNADKCQVITFNAPAGSTTAHYNIGRSPLCCVTDAVYLGVTLQSDLKFTAHINNKISKANKILGIIKRTLYGAPPKAKLMAYTALCRPVIEYASVLWDPHIQRDVYNIEMVQHRAVRFISGLKGQTDSVTEEMNKLGLKPLANRRKSQRVSLLMRILTNEECHTALSTTYDEIINGRRNITVTTRAAARGEPLSIATQSTIYHQSFLPRTVRDLRGE